MVATTAADQSFLADMIRLMEAAKVASALTGASPTGHRNYAPVVHLTAFVSLLGWMYVNGDWHQAITIAVAG